MTDVKRKIGCVMVSAIKRNAIVTLSHDDIDDTIQHETEQQPGPPVYIKNI